MAREIKFRAWVENHDAMHFSTDAGIDQLAEWVSRYGGHMMQFTGLKDSNGQDIYEGDLVAIRGINPSRPIEIRWRNNGWWCFFGGDCLYPLDKIDAEEGTVIGNIHENPELLR